MKFYSVVILFFLSCRLQSQVLFDGKITEPEWGVPLSTSLGGPAPCFDNGCRLNSLFASADNSNLLFAIGGNIQAGKHILLFIDSKTGGYNDGNFGRSNAPAGLIHYNSANKFDEGFFADFCLVISTNNTRSDYYFNLYTLGGTTATGGGENKFLGSAFTADHKKIGTDASDNDNTKGFEVAVAKDDLGFNPQDKQDVNLMAMIISEAGILDNQFLNRAAAGESCYTGNPVDFSRRAPGPATFYPDLLLPIRFKYFRVAERNNGVFLLWASELENNLREYEVQHSSDAILFTTAGTVAAKGNSPGLSTYEYAHEMPFGGKNYYRIKAIDLSGRSAYSPVVKVQYGYVDNTLGIFPNPVNNYLNLQLTGIAKGRYNLAIYNNSGQRVITRKIEYNGGYGIQQISLLPNLPKGPYRLLLSNGRGFYKQNFLVQ